MAEATLFRYLVDQRELKDPKAFIPRFREAAQQVAHADRDPDIGRYEPAASTVEAWYYGTRKPIRAARRILVAWFGYTIEQLWSPADAVLPELHRESSSSSSPDDRAQSGMALDDIKKGAQMAARRAREFAMGAERGQLGDETLGFLRDEVKEIAGKYQRVPLSGLR
jgi:hypothetical protein